MTGPQTVSSSSELEINQIGSVSTEIELPTLAVTQKLLSIWEDAHGLSGQLPHKSAFGMSALGDATPFVYILERIKGGDDFRVRFMGSAIAQSIGADYTGAIVGDHPNHPSSWRAEIYRMVIARREPVFTAVNLGDFERDYTKTECVLLPVSGDAGDVAWVVCAAAPYPSED